MMKTHSLLVCFHPISTYSLVCLVPCRQYIKSHLCMSASSINGQCSLLRRELLMDVNDDSGLDIVTHK